MNMNTVTLYAAKRRERDETSEKLKALNKQLEALGAAVLNEFAEHGVSSMKTEHGTLFTSKTLWAGAVQVEQPDGTMAGDAERTCRALEEAGYGWLVKPGFNAQSLSAAIRELPRDDDGNIMLPDALRGNISITEKPEIRLRGRAKNQDTDS